MPGWQPVVVTGYPVQPVVLEQPQVVQAIPMNPASFVTATLGMETDPVPMLDGTTAGILAATNKFRVVQRISIAETLCTICEKANVYDIYDGATGQPLFSAIEQSDGCTRCCCAPNHSFMLRFKPGMPGAPKDTLRDPSIPAVFTMEREGCTSKWGLGCCAFTESCKDGYLYT